MTLAPVEERMWGQSSTKTAHSVANKDIDLNTRYESREQRILTEINREKLPSFVESLKKPGYMDLRPFYQRRKRWDIKKQSQLIESFLINIPVPPIVLYEQDYNCYEVMDGQQRITAIQEFYEDKLILKGLELWPELNDLNYSKLPSKIKAGIDRRSISSIVIITESTKNPEEALFLKQKTFERLNTGGIALTPQEVRNCLYQGKFNELLFELSKNPIFVRAWQIHGEDSTDSHNNQTSKMYEKMEDIELILRFFALRNVEYFQGGLKKFLDLYMMKSLNFKDNDINDLRSIFNQTIELASEIYGNHLFCPYDLEQRTWKTKPYKAFYDAIMVGFSKYLDYATTWKSKKELILEQTKQIFTQPQSSLLMGGGKSKAEIQQRLQLFENLLTNLI
jgi:hypothetical protein